MNCNFQEAECDKTLMDAKFEADTLVADSERMFKMSQAAYQKEVNTAVSRTRCKL